MLVRVKDIASEGSIGVQTHGRLSDLKNHLALHEKEVDDEMQPTFP
jgi:hypothetical protein